MRLRLIQYICKFCVVGKIFLSFKNIRKVCVDSKSCYCVAGALMLIHIEYFVNQARCWQYIYECVIMDGLWSSHLLSHQVNILSFTHINIHNEFSASIWRNVDSLMMHHIPSSCLSLSLSLFLFREYLTDIQAGEMLSWHSIDRSNSYVEFVYRFQIFACSLYECWFDMSFSFLLHTYFVMLLVYLACITACHWRRITLKLRSIKNEAVAWCKVFIINSGCCNLSHCVFVCISCYTRNDRDLRELRMRATR